jgi:hypothetical protein
VARAVAVLAMDKRFVRVIGREPTAHFDTSLFGEGHTTILFPRPK